MSALYRSKRWLTLAQLVPAWARELVNATTSASECERELWHFLLEDIINGRFDRTPLGLAPHPARQSSRTGRRPTVDREDRSSRIIRCSHQIG